MRLTLASASPRRRDLLAGLGVEFDVLPTDVDELTDGAPEEVVLENARRKARAGRELAGDRGGIVLGVDTDVALDGRLLGKPADAEGARERLTHLSGRTHQVFSGLVALAPSREQTTVVERSVVVATEVTFHELDDATLELYLASEEWADRAGAYAIQGLGSILIAQIRGDFSNVVGLPLRALLDLVPELSLQGRDKRRKP